MDDLTLAYYDRYARAYIDRTVHADLSDVYRRFLALVPSGGRILDYGCGPGRDVLAFRRKGYQVLGIDPSEAMVTAARNISGAECRVGDHNAIRTGETFNGIWACASLLHVPRVEVGSVLSRLIEALTPQGAFYISVRRGSGERRSEDGRHFTDYSEGALRAVFAPFRCFESESTWISADADVSRTNIEWLNWLGVKRA